MLPCRAQPRFAPGAGVLVAALALAASTALAVPAHAAPADEKRACGEAYERAQELRQDGKLRAAREKLTVCARSSCPGVVQKDCSSWLAEVDQTLPSIVVSAQDGAGRDLVEVRVLVDGELLASSLDGKAMGVDPGPHLLRLEAAGFEPLEQRIVANEGEKRRKVTLKLRARGAPAGAGTDEKPEKGDRGERGEKGEKGEAQASSAGSLALPLVLAGVGVVGLGAGVYFRMEAGKGKDDLDAQGCKPNCSQSDVDAIKQQRLYSGLAFGVGAVAAASALYFFFSQPSEPSKGSASVRFGVSPTVSGASLAAWGSF